MGLHGLVIPFPGTSSLGNGTPTKSLKFHGYRDVMVSQERNLYPAETTVVTGSMAIATPKNRWIFCKGP